MTKPRKREARHLRMAADAARSLEDIGACELPVRSERQSDRLCAAMAERRHEKGPHVRAIRTV